MSRVKKIQSISYHVVISVICGVCVCPYLGMLLVCICVCVCVLYSAFISGSLKKKWWQQPYISTDQFINDDDIYTHTHKKCYGFSMYVFFSFIRVATGIEQCLTVAIIAKAFFLSFSLSLIYTFSLSFFSYFLFWLDWWQWFFLLFFFAFKATRKWKAINWWWCVCLGRLGWLATTITQR